MNLVSVLESLLFVVGDEGLSLDEVKKILEIDDATLTQITDKLIDNYQNVDRGIELTILSNRLKLITKRENKEYLQKLVDFKDDEHLTESALETLAIIAYNQPITRASVDNLRGISNNHIIRKLVAKGLIKESGRSPLPGRPILYETTSEFLDYFGLSSINDLPDMRDFLQEETVEEDVDLYQSKYKEQI